MKINEISREEAMYFIDKAGHRVYKNDYIVYGHNVGRCGGLRFGKVLQIIKIKLEPYRDGTERIDWSIRIMGINDDQFTGCNKIKPTLCGSKGTLQFPDRCLLATEMIPKSYKLMLGGY